MNRTREVVLVAPPNNLTVCDASPRVSFGSVFLITPKHRHIFPPISRCIPDNENTISFRVKDDGTTDLPEEICQVVGVEGQPQMWK